MNDRPEDWKGPPKHTCSTCGEKSAWDENWKWYGSIRELEDLRAGDELMKFCSDKCIEAAVRANLVPAVA